MQDGEYQAKEGGIIQADNIISECWDQFVIDLQPMGDMVKIECLYREAFYIGFDVYSITY